MAHLPKRLVPATVLSERPLVLYARFVEQFPDPLCVVDRGYTFATVNSAFSELLGRPPEALVGTSLEDVAHRVAGESLIPYLENCFKGGTTHAEVLCPLLAGYPLGLRCWALPSEDGIIRYVALSLREIRGISPDEVNQLRADLGQARLLAEEAVFHREQLEETLLSQQAKYDAVEQRRGVFLAALAHQLRGPLSPIGNAAQFLRRRLPPDPEIQWCLSLIDRQVSQVSRLVNDLMDVGQLNSGQLTLQREQLLLADVVDRALEGVRPILEKQRQALLPVYPNPPLWVDGDPARLHQVIDHLLRQASRQSPALGRIRLIVRREGNYAVVYLRDSGQGMEQEQLSRLFDLYNQSPTQPERLAESLGLVLVRHLVELHGGTITVTSDGSGLGTEFIFRLPLVESVGQISPVQPLSSSQRIVVVDDNADVAASFEALLEVLGHDVRVALDGITALDLVATFKPQVVFLDIAMPGMDGYEVARRLRETYPPAVLQLVAITGYSQTCSPNQAEEVGFDHYLVKPVEFKELQAVLNLRKTPR